MKKLLLFALFIVGNIFCNTVLIEEEKEIKTINIWRKEIPPSLYLEKLALNREQRYLRWTYFWGGFGIFYGLVSGVSVDENHDLAEMRPFVMGVPIIAGLTRIFITAHVHVNEIPKTDAGKKYKIIKDIHDMDQKEETAYESLVSLSVTSRIKQDDKFMDNQFYLMINKDWLTAEEQALDDFIKQIPIIKIPVRIAIKSTFVALLEKIIELKGSGCILPCTYS